MENTITSETQDKIDKAIQGLEDKSWNAETSWDFHKQIQDILAPLDREFDITVGPGAEDGSLSIDVHVEEPREEEA